MENRLNWMRTDGNNLYSVPERSGVYLVSCICEDGKEYVIYCGQSTNLYRRLKEHWSDNEENYELREAIRKHSNSLRVYYAVTSQYNLDVTEKYLYEVFKPQFQDRAPDVIAVPCNYSLYLHKGTVNFRL